MVQIAVSTDDALLMLGETPPGLILYGVQEDFEAADTFMQQVRSGYPGCQIALMVAPGRAAELTGLMEHGPMIVLRRPVERPDLVSLLALVY